jgi:Gly-Xaa carboxypeptidase
MKRYFWNLTKNIYRFTPIDRAKSINLHTVDERLFFNDHIDAVWSVCIPFRIVTGAKLTKHGSNRFFHELARSYDEAEL